jgi:aspartokinase/homoserine dehydrogenase 1
MNRILFHDLMVPGHGGAVAPSLHRAIDARVRSPRLSVLCRANLRQRVRVMKFGGTSVGDASCIGQVADLILNDSREGRVVVVVSAMCGVTDRLIEGAALAQAGRLKPALTILGEVRSQHETAARLLIGSVAADKAFAHKMQNLIGEGTRLCERTARLRALTPHMSDSISSIGERLCAPLVAAALAERGAACEPIEATELIVTDSRYGAAEPCMTLTRERCLARLGPLLERGLIPVVTGFIAASLEGALTTLGRGGSDYSATILAAALEAHDVVIWTDVDGLLTADPRLVGDARTLREISYHEASTLARYGAKVLHPRTLHALGRMESPVWIRNTFAPERDGTKITPDGPPAGTGVRALAALRDVALVTIGTPGALIGQNMLRHALPTAVARAGAVLAWESPASDEINFVARSPDAGHTIDALLCEVTKGLSNGRAERITLNPAVAIVTAVGTVGDAGSRVAERGRAALVREGMNAIATVQGPSNCSVSFVVPRREMQKALGVIHTEFQLGRGERFRVRSGAKPWPASRVALES